jgi:hypothetical protein
MATWKGVEGRLAKIFDTTRTPLSGGNSKMTRSDTLHKDIFFEVKHRKKHTTWSLWNETATLAKKENKIPVIALHEKGKHGYLLVVNTRHLKEFIEVVKDSRLFIEMEEYVN